MHCLETTKMFPISEAEGLITKQASMGLKGPHTQLTHSSRCLEQSELVFLGCPLSQVTYCFILLKASTILETGFFFSSCPLFFTRLYTYTCFFDVCFCFLGTGGFRTQIRSARFYRFFVLFVCLFFYFLLFDF